MKVMSFNVNSVRARLPHLQTVLERHDPDVLGLQEIKVRDDEFPAEQIEQWGYQASFHGQKTHYGVAILSKENPQSIQKGFVGDKSDAHRRLIVGGFQHAQAGEVIIINGYFPQGENRSHASKFPAKEKFYSDLLDLLNSNYSPDDQIIVLGDLNIAPQDRDIGIGEPNRKRWLRDGKCCFLPEEREWYSRLEAWGLQDTFRLLHPDTTESFSWFDYRSRGFEKDPRRGLRIDLIMATRSLAARCVDAGIDLDIRAMERPSDHCPIWAEFN